MKTLGQLDAMSPVERRAYWRKLRLQWQLDYLEELATDHARDAQLEIEQQQDYTAIYKQASI